MNKQTNTQQIKKNIISFALVDDLTDVKTAMPMAGYPISTRLFFLQ